MPFHLDLVSPERLLMSEEAAQAVVPGAEGYFTVLPGHAPFMSTLKPGVLEITPEGGATRKFFVRGGFADVNPAGLTVLADHAVPLEELDAAGLADEVRLAEEDLAALGDDAARRVGAEQRLNDVRDVQRWIIPA